MTKLLIRYGFVVFILNTILLNIIPFYSLGKFFFILFMGFFSLLFIISKRQIKLVLFHPAFLFFLILNIINLFYFLLVHDFNDYRAIEYLLARFVQFLLIILSVFYNYRYFINFFHKHIAYVILCIVFFSIFFDNNLSYSLITGDILSNRWSGIIWNPNQLSNYICIAFAALLLGNKKLKNIDIFFLIILFLASLFTGSRSVIVAIPLAFFIKYGLSRLNLLFVFLSIILYFLVTNFNLETSINRFSDQSLLSDRTLQLKYAYKTLMHKPILGFGLDHYAYIEKSLKPSYLESSTVFSAHNGYLALLVQYGIVFGLIIIALIFYNVIIIINNPIAYKNSLFYVYILIYTLISAVYESLFTGINDFHTNMFWLSLCLLLFSRYRINYAN